TGTTFVNGSVLPIGRPCCANGANIVVPPEAAGTPVGTLLRTRDAGPGADGIPGCFGDTALLNNGVNACNQRLRKGNSGAKSDPQFDTGIDDVVTALPSARFGTRNLGSGLPAYNQVASFALHDLDVLFQPDNADLLLKQNVSHCPILNGKAECGTP